MVVSVTIRHQSASPIVAKWGFVGCSAWYAASDTIVTTSPATTATVPGLAARRRRPAVAISTRATRRRAAERGQDDRKACGAPRRRYCCAVPRVGIGAALTSQAALSGDSRADARMG